MRDVVGSIQILLVVLVEEILTLTAHNLQRTVGIVQLLRGPVNKSANAWEIHNNLLVELLHNVAYLARL